MAFTMWYTVFMSDTSILRQLLDATFRCVPDRRSKHVREAIGLTPPRQRET